MEVMKLLSVVLKFHKHIYICIDWRGFKIEYILLGFALLGYVLMGVVLKSSIHTSTSTQQ